MTRLLGPIALMLVLVHAAVRADDRIGTLKQELALAKKAGLPTTPAEMNRRIPSTRDAAPFYLKLVEKVNHASEPDLEIERGTVLGRVRPTADQIARARRELLKRKDQLALIHQAAAMPDCAFPRDWSLGPALQLPEYRTMRAAARWLTAESGLLLWDGKPIEAVRNAALAFRIAKHAEADGVLIAHLVSIAIDAITMRALQNILYHAGGQAGVAEAVRRAVETGWEPRSLSQSVRGEMAMIQSSLELVRKGGLEALRQLAEGEEPAQNAVPQATDPKTTRWLVDQSGAIAIHGLRVLYEAGDLPYPRAKPVFEAQERRVSEVKDPYLALAVVLAPPWGNLPKKRSQDIALARVTQAAASFLAWKAKTGRFPERLPQAIKQTLTDPFDLKPLRYRAVGSGFMVWSVGETGKFAGNASSAREYNREPVFRWPMPDMLRQPINPSAN